MSAFQPPSSTDRRRLLQGMAALPLAGLPAAAWSPAFPTAKVNTTKLAVTDTEVTFGQLHSATGTMAISETGSIQAEQLAIDQPPGIRAEYDRIRMAKGNEHAALHTVLECLAEVIWNAQRHGTPPDGALYLACLARQR